MKALVGLVLVVGIGTVAFGQDQSATQEKPVMANQTTAAAGKRTAELSVDLKATPEAVWNALSTAEGLTRWFPLEAKVTPGVGGSVWSSWGSGVQWDSPIAIWEPDKRMRVLWCPANTPEPELFGVDYFIEDRGGGTTRLRLVHFGFSRDAQWDAMYDGVSRGWDFMLWGMKNYLEQHPGQDRKVIFIHRDLKNVGKEQAWAAVMSRGGLLGPASLSGLKPGEKFEGQLAGQDISGTVRVNLPGKDFQATIQTLGGAMLRFQTDPCKGGPGDEFSATLAVFGVDPAKVDRIGAAWNQRLDSALGAHAAAAGR